MPQRTPKKQISVSHSVGRYSPHAPGTEKDDLYFGPKCFTVRIRKISPHSGFAKVGPTYQKYIGSTNPDTWMSDYQTAVQINRGTDLEAVKFLPLMLLEGAWDWINGLPSRTIDSWDDMARVFAQHFRGTYKRPKSINQLNRCAHI